MPIFLGIIGGIIAYFVLRKDDPRKAKNCLYLGIVLAIVGIVLNLVMATQITDIGNEIGSNVRI